MAKTIQAIRGMHDILPGHTSLWQHLEAIARQTIASYGYREIRLPVVEKTELFQRSIGEATDIVEKEMYSFDDRNGDGLTLRPEGTAGCVRAGIEHGLLYNQTHRLWYGGPMFRHERPQKGRYRQFHQIGVEAFGLTGPDIDAELILLSRRIWEGLGLDGRLELQINSLGSPEERAVYRGALVEYLADSESELDEDSRRRLHSNPLRVLDSKVPSMQPLIAGAPQLWDYLGGESRAHFERLTDTLETAGVAYTFNGRLVRGLDYYSKTVFEWVTDELGAQATVCAGGRYDGLVSQLGGRATPAVGFAIGMERLILLLEQLGGPTGGDAPHAYLVVVGELARAQGLLLAERLRRDLSGLRLMMDCGGGSMKSQFKRADKSGARFAFILGEDEAARAAIAVKPLREPGEQRVLAQDELADHVRAVLRMGD